MQDFHYNYVKNKYVDEAVMLLIVFCKKLKLKIFMNTSKKILQIT